MNEKKTPKVKIQVYLPPVLDERINNAANMAGLTKNAYIITKLWEAHGGLPGDNKTNKK